MCQPSRAASESFRYARADDALRVAGSKRRPRPKGPKGPRPPGFAPPQHLLAQEDADKEDTPWTPQVGELCTVHSVVGADHVVLYSSPPLPGAQADVEDPGAQAELEEPGVQADIEVPGAQAYVEEPGAQADVEEPADAHVPRVIPARRNPATGEMLAQAEVEPQVDELPAGGDRFVQTTQGALKLRLNILV